LFQDGTRRNGACFRTRHGETVRVSGRDLEGQIAARGKHGRDGFPLALGKPLHHVHNLVSGFGFRVSGFGFRV
jgi:hypothetical protein